MMKGILVVVLAIAVTAAQEETTKELDDNKEWLNDDLDQTSLGKRTSLFNGASCSGVLQLFGIDDLFSDLNDTKEAVMQELENLKSSKGESTPDYEEISLSYVEPKVGMSISEAERREYLQDLQERSTLTMIPALVAVILIAVIGVIGNSLVLYIYSFKFPLNGTRVFILVIAGFDLFINVVVLPGVVYNMLHTWDFDQRWLCRLRMYINGITTLVSAHLLTALAVVRYRKVCASTGWQITARHAKYISWAIVIACCILSIPYAVIMGTRTIPTARPGIYGYGCDVDDAFVKTIWPLAQSALFILLYLVNAITIVVLYALVGSKALRTSRKIQRTISLERSSSRSGTTTASMVDYKKRDVESDDISSAMPEEKKDGSVKILKTQRSVSFSKGFGFKKKHKLSEGGEDRRDVKIEEDRSTADYFTDDEETASVQIAEESSGSKEAVDLSMFREVTSNTETVLQNDGSTEESKGGQEHEPAEGKDSEKANGDKKSTSTSEVSDTGEKSSKGDAEVIGESKALAIDEEPKSKSVCVKDDTSEEGDGRYQKKKPKRGKLSKSGSMSFARKLSRAGSFLTKGRNGSVQSPRPKRNLNRTTCMLIMISAVYVLGYIPFLGLSIYFAMNPKAKQSLDFTGHVLFNLFFRFHCLNFAANAVIYFIFDLTFRDHCMNAIRKALCSRGLRHFREPSSATN